MYLNLRSATFWITSATILKAVGGFVHNFGRMSSNSSPPRIFSSKVNDGSPDAAPQEETVTELPAVKKLHTMTVCMVPESKYADVWEAVTKARTELRDPGLFRWPPHANMLYPFLDIKPKNSESFDEDKLDLLSAAVKKCEPFQVSFDSFGTFGGQHRGVLYLYPRSFRDCDSMQQSTLSEEDSTNEEPLVQLQSILQEHLPECDDQKKNGKYTPHITLSHFPSLEEALDGQAKLETWWQSKEFIVNEIYVLKRIGDDGQFKILASLPLGENTLGAQIHDPPIVFPGMPLVEEDWVREERMALKARRNGNGRRGTRRNGRRKRGPVDRGPNKIRDTPEVIAKKRAERVVKRELLAQEVAAISAAIGGDDSSSSLF
mmetsp:Transcript_2100/g.3193  ORF Transcript_2100/g.3193 Transcript_2100/m.3193 type:complete len:375 (-) Transcript_2100:79-1203(-)